MSDKYVIWKYQSEPFAAVLKKLTGLEKIFRLQDGTHLQEGFPGNVAYHMHPDFPNDLVLVDNMLNLDKILVTSTRLKQAIESRGAPNIEYLPLAITDHKGRQASKDYFVLHPVDPVDCIDREHSVFEEDMILPGDIESFKRLVIDETRVPADRQLFRLRGFWDITLVRRDLAEALDQEKFTGLTWQRIQDYPRKQS
jgi:hypothetical protein